MRSATLHKSVSSLGLVLSYTGQEPLGTKLRETLRKMKSNVAEVIKRLPSYALLRPSSDYESS